MTSQYFGVDMLVWAGLGLMSPVLLALLAWGVHTLWQNPKALRKLFFTIDWKSVAEAVAFLASIAVAVSTLVGAILLIGGVIYTFGGG